MKEVKICVDDNGVLVAVYPDGHVGPIFVDIPNTAYYGCLIAGAPLPDDEMRRDG